MEVIQRVRRCGKEQKIITVPKFCDIAIGDYVRIITVKPVDNQ